MANRFGRGLHGDSLFKHLAQRLLIGEDPRIKFFDREAQRPGNWKPITLLCLLELRMAFVLAIRVGYQDQAVKPCSRGVQHRLQGELEVPTAFSWKWIAARQVAHAYPFVGCVRWQDPFDKRP
jgi:hypothetical protein